jgi:hypothetical protein
MSRDPHRALLAALADYLGPLDDVVAKTRDWASATFVGMQHEIAFACTAHSALIDALPDVDLPMDGQFVADLVVVSCEVQGTYLYVVIEVLTVRA